MLFAVVFFWTPPHTSALALRYREDYANVDVPMLPWWPAREVGRQVVLYSWVMVATSLLLWPVPTPACLPRRRGASWARSSCSRRTGCGRGPRHRGPRLIQPMRLFHSSNLDLSLLFVAVALDPILAF